MNKTMLAVAVSAVVLSGCFARPPTLAQQYTQEQWLELPAKDRAALMQYETLREAQRARVIQNPWARGRETVCTTDRNGLETRCR